MHYTISSTKRMRLDLADAVHNVERGLEHVQLDVVPLGGGRTTASDERGPVSSPYISADFPPCRWCALGCVCCWSWCVIDFISDESTGLDSV
jgi:hypothetical protein